MLSIHYNNKQSESLVLGARLILLAPLRKSSKLNHCFSETSQHSRRHQHQQRQHSQQHRRRSLSRMGAMTPRAGVPARRRRRPQQARLRLPKSRSRSVDSEKSDRDVGRRSSGSDSDP